MKDTLKKHYSEHDRTYCHICKKNFDHLGSHIWHKHKLKANDYKGRFGLPYSLALISQEVELKKKIHFQKHRKKYLKNITSKKSDIHKFKPGHNKNLNRYFAKREIERATKTIRNTNENINPGMCPVCNMFFKNVNNHLLLKHGLLKVDKTKK